MSERPKRSSLEARLRARVGDLSIDVELDTGAGALVLVGPNGAGKSSILRLLLGVLTPSSGTIRLGERLLFDGATGVAAPLEARRLGYLPQDYALFPHLTVRGNVEFAVRSRPSVRSRDVPRLVERSLGKLGLGDLADRPVRSLSGGEKQRTALARALSVEPEGLLLDEPLGALDVHARRATRAFLASSLRELGLPTVIVTHDPLDARELGARLLVVENGRVTQRGTWDEVARAPRSPFVEEFVAALAPPAS